MTSGTAYRDTRYQQARKQLRTYDHICHLCGKAIDMTRKFPDPQAWACDHIIPTSQLPEGDDRQWHISNLQAAHARCNSSRGSQALGINASRDW